MIVADVDDRTHVKAGPVVLFIHVFSGEVKNLRSKGQALADFALQHSAKLHVILVTYRRTGAIQPVATAAVSSPRAPAFLQPDRQQDLYLTGAQVAI